MSIKNSLSLFPQVDTFASRLDKTLEALALIGQSWEKRTTLGTTSNPPSVVESWENFGVDDPTRWTFAFSCQLASGGHVRVAAGQNAERAVSRRTVPGALGQSGPDSGRGFQVKAPKTL